MHGLLKIGFAAAALLAAVPAYAQWDGPGRAGPGYGYDYNDGYDYGQSYGGGYRGGYGGGPGYMEPYNSAPVYEGRSVAVEPPAGAGDDVAYCQQRFRSYDPQTGTYLGYDGMRHSCP